MGAHTGFPQLGRGAMRISAMDLEEACEVAKLGVWQWTVESSQFDWSTGVYEIAGREPDDFYPTLESTFACIHPDDRAGTRARLDDVAKNGAAATGWEFRIIRPGGEARLCWAKVRPLTHARLGKVVRGVLLDITDQRSTELALQSSQDDARYAFELNPQIPWTADPDGNIVDAGPNWSALIGSTPGGWLTAVHSDDAGRVADAWSVALQTGQALDVRFRVRQLNSSYCWVRSRGRARRDASGNILRWYGLLEDISEQVAAEAALRASQEWMWQAHEAAGIGLFEIDLKANLARLSPQSLALHGISGNVERVFTEAEWRELVHPEDGIGTWQAVHRAAETGQPYDHTFRIVTPDGDCRWINGIGRVEYDDDGGPKRLLGINLDVTARRVAEKAAANTEALINSIVQTSPDSIKVIDGDDRVVFVNSSGRGAMELHDDTSLIGQRWLDCWPSSARHRVETAMAAARREGIGRFTAPRATGRGTPKWWDVIVSRVEGDDGDSSRLISVARDITEGKETEERISWNATHDALTELPNRRLFETRLSQTIEEAEISGQQFAVVILDLDDLKLVNDSLGHDAGDELLRELSARLRSWMPDGGTIARLGGDEFAIIIRPVASVDELCNRADALIHLLNRPMSVTGKHVDCRTSMGASIYPQHGSQPSELMKHADIALYQAKELSRGRMRIFVPEMRANLQRRVSMINIAKDALRGGRIVPFYQPKVSLLDGSICGFEALARLVDRSGKPHAPKLFEAAFDDPQTSLAITDAMFSQVLEDIGTWSLQAFDFGSVALNVSAYDFARPAFADHVLSRLANEGIKAEKLQIEVTETVFLGRAAEQVGPALRCLSEAGVAIAFDDFGTGYASLTHLKQFPVDTVKIDRSFVVNIAGYGTDAAIASSVINLAKDLGIEVIAEGIEEEVQAEHLRRLGCRIGQGYLFARPMSAQAAADRYAGSSN